MSQRAKAVIAVIALQLTVTVASIADTVAELGLLQRARRGEPVILAEIEASDERTAAVGVLVLVSFFVAGIAWLVWQHGAHRQLRRLGVQDLRFTPGWGVGWWFVPFLNLVRPYQAVRELWLASDPRTGSTDWRRGPTTVMLPLWWAAFLISSFLSRYLVVSYRSGSDPTIEGLITNDYLSIVGDLTWLVAGIPAILIVREIDRRQSLISRWTPPPPDGPARPDVGLAP